ncbi:uncharacterized protein V6R79_017054 [Siganus canaliculatus]
METKQLLLLLLLLLLLTCLLLTGVRSEKEAKFMYSLLGSEVLLPCAKPLSPGCSSVSWTFYKGGQVVYITEVDRGRVNQDSNRSSRMSVTSNCSLRLRDLRTDDAGSYVCQRHREAVANVYLSLLSVTSRSSVTQLQAGGNVTLHCVLFSFYDAGSCRSRSSGFSLNWVQQDGGEGPRDRGPQDSSRPQDSRYELIRQSHCNVTLVTNLNMEDNNRRWRCQLSTRENNTLFIDFTSTFVFGENVAAQTTAPPATDVCPVHLPISRIVLCAALPLLVVIVGFRWRRRGHEKMRKTTEAAVEL